MTKLYKIKYKTNVLHDRLTAEECSEQLQNYIDRFFSAVDAPNAWPFNPNDLIMEEIIDAS